MEFYETDRSCSYIVLALGFVVGTKRETLAFSGTPECPEYVIDGNFSILKLRFFYFLNEMILG